MLFRKQDSYSTHVTHLPCGDHENLDHWKAHFGGLSTITADLTPKLKQYVFGICITSLKHLEKDIHTSGHNRVSDCQPIQLNGFKNYLANLRDLKRIRMYNHLEFENIEKYVSINM